MLAEMFLHREAREKSPRLVVAILVEDRQTTFGHDARQFSDQQRGIVNEGNHPAAPGEIVISSRQIISHQIDVMNFHVHERLRAAGCLHRADKISGTFKRDYFTGRADDLRKIDGRVTGTRAHIKHAFADRKTCPLPAI